VIAGALAGPIESAPLDVRARALSSLTQLPPEIGLASFRDLATLMSDLVERHRINVLSLEALAAAVFLSAEIVMAGGGENPLPAQAVSVEGVVVHVVDVGFD
jgi:hypothetical protein